MEDVTLLFDDSIFYNVEMGKTCTFDEDVFWLGDCFISIINLFTF